MAKRRVGAAAVRNAEMVDRDDSAEAVAAGDDFPSLTEFSNPQLPVPGPDCLVVTMQLPLAAEAVGMARRHVELQFVGRLGAKRRGTMHRLFMQLRGAEMEDGRFVQTPAQALYWLLDDLAKRADAV